MITIEEIEAHNERIEAKRCCPLHQLKVEEYLAMLEKECEGMYPVIYTDDAYYRKPTNPDDEYMCRPGSISYKAYYGSSFIQRNDMD